MDIFGFSGHVNSHEYVIPRHPHPPAYQPLRNRQRAPISASCIRKHSGLVMFEISSRDLDVLCPAWRHVIIGISMDGEINMTGCVSAVATHFQKVANPAFIRIWYGAHQVDIVLQEYIIISEIMSSIGTALCQ